MTSINDTIPKRDIIKALYKCDSLNTLLTENLQKAEKKDSLQNLQNLVLADRIVYLQDLDKAKDKIHKKELKKSKNSGIFKGTIFATLVYVILTLTL